MRKYFATKNKTLKGDASISPASKWRFRINFVKQMRSLLNKIQKTLGTR
jgi:hypothetical protein